MITTACGKQAKIYRFDYDLIDKDTLSKWAKHFRNHYCLDQDVDDLKLPSQTRSEYLLSMKFPSKTTRLGPSVRIINPKA